MIPNVGMSPARKQIASPSVPQNIQALINANESYARSVSQAKDNLALSNETKFREQHSSFIHNAEARRNVRRSREEAALARLDFILDRRAQLAQLFAEERGNGIPFSSDRVAPSIVGRKRLLVFL
jgi:hypothetical protein